MKIKLGKHYLARNGACVEIKSSKGGGHTFGAECYAGGCEGDNWAVTSEGESVYNHGEYDLIAEIHPPEYGLPVANKDTTPCPPEAVPASIGRNWRPLAKEAKALLDASVAAWDPHAPMCAQLVSGLTFSDAGRLADLITMLAEIAGDA